MTRSLILFVANEELREKKGYIYAVSGPFEHIYTWDYVVRGFEITTEIKNLEKALIGLRNIIQTGAIKFLKSKQGKLWLENWISGFIFPHTPGYIEDYAESLGFTIIKGHDIWEFEKAKEVALKIKVQEIIDHIENIYIKEPFYTWIDTSEEIEKVKKIVENL